MDKPDGWTSHDVVAVVRRRLGLRSVGHAGTLDPFATGLLVVLVGKATRLARFIEGLPKRYDAVARLGTATDTDDPTGAVTATGDGRWPSREVVEAAVQQFAGEFAQRPPSYSAKHVAGQRSHALARAGIAVELAPVTVRVYDIATTSYDPPDVGFTATVGRGTYIRSIARDLGERLGTMAHCAALRRVTTGGFSVSDAVAPEAVGPERLIAPAQLVGHLDRRVLDPVSEREVSFGRSVMADAECTGPLALLAGDGRLLAIAELRDGRAHPVVVLEPAA